MSSKAASAMSEESNIKSALVPRLRFPGFLEDWASSPMSELYSFKGNNSLSRDKLNYEAGELRNIHYGDIHTKFALHFRVDAERVPYINAGESSSAIRPENYCMAGDMVFADASEDMADIGKAIEIIDAGDVPLVSGLHTILARPGEGSFALGFGAYLFSSEGVRKQIQRESQGAKVLGLSATRLGNVQLHYPGKPDEQQKITDCLSSLDELIAAETQKLDTLKSHKKGLMQQLFPREGETVPRLRFPEFQDAGEWESVPMGSLLARNPEYGVNAPASPFSEDRPTYLRITDIDEDGRFLSASKVSVDIVATDDNYLEPGDIVLARTGASVGKSYRYRKEDGRLVFAGFLIRIRPEPKKINPIFLANFLTTQQYWDWVGVTSARSGQPGINGTEYSSLPVPVPSLAEDDKRLSEQRRIAECLSSLDDLITAQSQKIDALKAHKKGLMQQLFPVLDEATA